MRAVECTLTDGTYFSTKFRQSLILRLTTHPPCFSKKNQSTMAMPHLPSQLPLAHSTLLFLFRRSQCLLEWDLGAVTHAIGCVRDTTYIPRMSTWRMAPIQNGVAIHTRRRCLLKMLLLSIHSIRWHNRALHDDSSDNPAIRIPPTTARLSTCTNKKARAATIIMTEAERQIW